jgi:short-subunit dehydrogenase
MRSFDGQTWWLVGASEGLGLALAQKLSAAGANLVLSARTESALAAAAATLPGPARVVPMDVASDDSVAQAAAQVGQVDGLVFLAAVYWPMPAQDWDAAKVTAMCDVNLTGCARVLGQVVPQMVARKAGHILLTGSLSGFRGLPGAIGYAASKAGVMVLAESLYADLRKTGITVQVANPGFIRTRLTAMNDFKMPFIQEPEQAADLMFRHLQSGGFKRSFPRPFSWLFRGGQLLPDRLWYGMFPPKGR